MSADLDRLRKLAERAAGWAEWAKDDEGAAAIRELLARVERAEAAVDLTWFWEIVDRDGFAEVPSDERDALARLVVAGQRAEAAVAEAVAKEREDCARVCDEWEKMDADIGAMKAAVSRLMGPDWPDEGAPVATVRELAATRQYTAQGLAHAIRARGEASDE